MAKADQSDISPDDHYRQAYDRSIRLLARREHSRLELSHKLSRKDTPEAILEQLLEDLAEQGLQSDDRFAGSFCRERAGRGIGPVRIRAELKDRGVAGGLIDEALRATEQNTDWYELAETVREKRFGPGRAADFKEAAKQKRFLQYRGFPLEVIQEIVSG